MIRGLGRWGGVARGRRDPSRTRDSTTGGGAFLAASSIAAPTSPTVDRATITSLFAAAAAAGVTAIIDGNYTLEWGVDVPVGLSSLRVAAGCTLALSNARTSTLTGDTSIGATVFPVTDGTQFRVGEMVVISDSNRVVQGGGNQTRKNGFASQVVSIAGNNVTLQDASLYAFTTAASATMGSCQNLLTFSSACAMSGPGTIDANQAGAYDIHPIDVDSVESERSGCAAYLTAGSAPAYVTGLTVKGGSLHGLVLRNSTGGSVTSCTFRDAHDKNLMLRGCVGTAVTNITCTNALHEDGIILYAGNTNIAMSGITVSDCNRYGMSVNNGTGHTVTNATITECARGFYDGATGTVVTNLSVVDCGTGQFGLVGFFGVELEGVGTGGSLTTISVTGVCTFTAAALGFNGPTGYTVVGATLTKGVGSGATIAAVRFYTTATSCSVTGLASTDWAWGIRGEVAGVTTCLAAGTDVGSTTNTLNVTGIDVSGMVFT